MDEPPFNEEILQTAGVLPAAAPPEPPGITPPEHPGIVPLKEVAEGGELPPGAQLTILTGLPRASYRLRLGETVIGRSADADLQFKHPEISRRHCRVDWNGQTAWVEDMESRWGTRVNGAALPAHTKAPLQPGDRLQVGPVTSYYGFGEPPPDAEPPPPADSPSHRPALPPVAAADGLAALATGESSVGGPEVLVRGVPVDRIPLGDHLTLGRGDDNDVVLADPSISRRHVSLERTGAGYQVTDLHSRAGSLVNGRRFESHRLVIGDRLQMGPFFFGFDGQALERTSGLAGIEIEARHVSKRAGLITILDDVSVKIERGQFVAILGPSGSGKSSLLDALTGLRPGQSGQILFDGADFYRYYNQVRSLLGYVPQDDIVHTELTVAQALLFSAQLRLPARTPRVEIEKLVAQTIERLGLGSRVNTPIARLSGGQRKRVSVGVELLGHPAVLFLDEPTSGLDPAAEFRMMELLRHLADGGCTVICATHVMENVYLTDRIFVIASGKVVFAGNVQEAREQFGVQKLNLLYDRLDERPAAEWRARFLQANPAAEAVPLSAPTLSPSAPPPRFKAQPRKTNLVTLLRRQWAILAADWKNFLILLGQPLVIALLVAWVSDDVSLSLFFAYLSTLWFGCSNAAQEIVKEIPIYRRERMVGLGRHTYLMSKFLLMGAVTTAQALFLYGILRLLARTPLDGNALWQMGALLGTALSGIGIGFAISAWARQTMQAVMIVPLVLIPQIVFSGMVFPATSMKGVPLVLPVSRAVPSFAGQTMMDISFLWQKTIDADLLSQHIRPYRNLTIDKAFPFKSVYNDRAPAFLSIFTLVGWMVLGYTLAWFGLRAKERG